MTLRPERTLRRAHLGLMALEPRWMFDGAAVVEATHAHAAADAAAKAAIPDAPAPVTIRAADTTKDTGKKEVLFVDTSVTDFKTLEAAIKPGIGIEEINGATSGLAQMAKWAESHSGYDSISILSHGAEATVTIGADTITDAKLADPVVAAELAEIGHALNAGGDLLLYGCDIAKGVDGDAFITAIAAATGATVAASTDTTGSALVGGNWSLEASTKPMASYTAFDGGDWHGELGGISWADVRSSNLSALGARSIDSSATDETTYLVFQDTSTGAQNALKVVKWGAQTSQWLVVGNADFTQPQASSAKLAFYNGTPYVAYVEGSGGNSGRISVMKLDSSSNTWVAVGNSGFSSVGTSFLSLAIAGDGTPYVGFENGATRSGDLYNYAAMVMKLDNGTNQWVNVGNSSISGESAVYESLAIDPTTNTPYITYGSYSQAFVKYYSDATGWTSLGSALSSGYTSLETLAFDLLGTPYLAYENATNGNPIHITVQSYNRGTSSWSVVGGEGFAPTDTSHVIDNLSLAIDSTNAPYVAYSDYNLSSNSYYGITVMKYDGSSSWTTVGNADFSGGGNHTNYQPKLFRPSLSFDRTNILYVSYNGFSSVFNISLPAVMRYGNTIPDFSQQISTSFQVKQSGGPTDITNLLTISDIDPNQTETWTSLVRPSHGTLSFTSMQAASGTSSITPSSDSPTYTPDRGYIGTDTFTIKVSDGADFSTRTFTVSVNPVAPGGPVINPSTTNTPNNIVVTGTNAAGDTSDIIHVFLDVNHNGRYDQGIDVAGTAIAGSHGDGQWTMTLDASGIPDGRYIPSAYLVTPNGSTTTYGVAGRAIVIWRVSRYPAPQTRWRPQAECAGYRETLIERSWGKRGWWAYGDLAMVPVISRP